MNTSNFPSSDQAASRPVRLPSRSGDPLASGRDQNSASPDDPGASLHRRIRSLSTLGAGFAGQHDVQGLLRELQMRLPQLIDYALCWARCDGCELVELTSALDRSEAHAFYRDLGFAANSLRFRKLLRD